MGSFIIKEPLTGIGCVSTTFITRSAVAEFIAGSPVTVIPFPEPAAQVTAAKLKHYNSNNSDNNSSSHTSNNKDIQNTITKSAAAATATTVHSSCLR